jgi:hypothetical protein
VAAATSTAGPQAGDRRGGSRHSPLEGNTAHGDTHHR